VSKAIRVQSFDERRAEIVRLKEKLAATTAEAMILCGEIREQASSVGDEVTVWKSGTEEAAIVAAFRDTRASLDRFLEHLEQAEQS
jgi:hypothetical protein